MDTSAVANQYTSKTVRLTALAISAGALALSGTVAFADNGSASASAPTVTVQAPRVVHHSSVGTGGMAVEQLSLTRRVSFADLNLDTLQGKIALHERIRANAQVACQQLESLYSSMLWIDDVQSCVQHAMLTWMPQVRPVSLPIQ